MNYYPFHLGDYAAHTAHLEPMEDLSYRRMLDLYYRTEKPLPEPAEIARLIRMRDHAAIIRDVLNEFFEPSPEGYRHARCDAEIASFQAMAEGGRKGAAKRWAKGGDSPPIAPPLPTLPIPQCQPEPEPKYSVAKATGGKPPVDKSEDETKRELFDAGKSLLAEQGMPAKQTGSFIGKLAKDYGQAHALEAVRSAVVARPMGAAEYLKATCLRLAGERKDPVTVPSDEAARTAAYLAQQSARVHDPPPDLKERLKRAKQSVGTASLRAVA